MSAATLLRRLHEAAEAERAARLAVEAWMAFEARAGQPRTNRQAPAWPDYETACATRHRLTRALVDMLPELLAVVEGARRGCPGCMRKEATFTYATDGIVYHRGKDGHESGVCTLPNYTADALRALDARAGELTEEVCQ